MADKYEDRASCYIVRKVSNLVKILMDKGGIRIFWYEDKQTKDELLLERFYESEFDIQIKGRQYGDDAGCQIEIEYW